jgi:hypothetical protein
MHKWEQQLNALV